MLAVRKEPDNEKKCICFTQSVNGVTRNRFFVPELAGDVPVPVAVAERKRSPRAEVVGEVWSLPVSIWAPRQKVSDSRDFQDTEASIRACLELDWKLCLEAHSTESFLTKVDSSPGVIEACFDVLWMNVRFVYSSFDYYATIGSPEDVLHVEKAGYRRLIEDCGLIIPGSKHCSTSAFDQLFVKLNAQSDVARALNRQEWLQMLVRIAVLRYVTPGVVQGVPAALSELLSMDLMPKTDRRTWQDTFTFRDRYLYIQDVDTVLRHFETSLRSLFVVYAKGDGMLGDEMRSLKLIDYYEWRQLMRDLRFYDEDYKDREASLTFAWSRMRVIDERKSAVKLTQLSFEDFLECFVRIATLKAIPTLEQCFDAGYEDAGEMLVTMRDNQPDEYAEFIAANMRAWDDPLPEPIYQLVDSAGYFLIRSVQKALGEEQTSSNFVVTEKLATKFRDASLKLYGTQIQVDKLLVEAKK